MLASELLIGAIMAAELGDEGVMCRGYAAALLRAHRRVRGGLQLVVGPHDVARANGGVPGFPLEVRSAGQTQSVTVASRTPGRGSSPCCAG